MMNVNDILEALYRTDGPDIRTFLRRQVSSQAAADELLQETFLVAVRRPEALYAAVSRRGWLFGIAMNLVKTHFRARRRIAAAELPDQLGERPPPPIDPRIDDLRAEIDRLPDEFRQVIQMRLIEELSYAEIAEVLGIPVGTVRSRIHHAVSRLRDSLVEWNQ